MRALALALLLVPSALWAEDIALSSAVSAVTLYPDGATVTRSVPFSIPAGQHRLMLADLPRTTPIDAIRVAVSGATMGSVTARDDFVPPRDDAPDPALEAAEAEVERAEAALREAAAGVEAIRAEAEAARARLSFLKALREAPDLAEVEVAALREMTALIGVETLSALRSQQEAERRAADAQRALKPLEEALARARQARDALVPEDEARAMVGVEVSAPAAAEGVVTIEYPVGAAQWRPVYDLRLDRTAGQLTIERGALVAQWTGENWVGATLSLSTVRPSGQVAPAELWPDRRRIGDPAERYAVGAGAPMADAEMALSEPAPAPPIVATAEYDGLSVRYAYPDPVDIASGADNVRLALGTLSTAAEISARAVPMLDATAYLMAEITNDTGELILPGAEAAFYLDGRYIGVQSLELIPAGGTAALAFGPIEGLRLTRTVEDREEGDRGVIRKSNEETEAVRIEVENLTGETWPLRVIDRVPFSEQEDLEITWKADPAPAETDIDGKRGVMAWRVELAPGETREIALSHRIVWPDGKVLR
ncbi:uncharacterized protein Ga0609869_003393 [Rhodovulum iodosum]|uniref:Mucoidy inhibitor MuiA family protein n=1 Tax=Rhodovulum iodosum TaxID=68291 RepID=A0ABV3XXD7_9RHOB|nr:DUF4139 domain-containing protein [Rhodovulum robiginosum]RSK40214.1 mucoidy inhibitor MuiA family protein [Rhodovulum robiginosum]